MCMATGGKGVGVTEAKMRSMGIKIGGTVGAVGGTVGAVAISMKG